MVTPDGAREAADWYLAGQDARHPYASPLYADLHGLPRADARSRIVQGCQGAGLGDDLERPTELPRPMA